MAIHLSTAPVVFEYWKCSSRQVLSFNTSHAGEYWKEDGSRRAPKQLELDPIRDLACSSYNTKAHLSKGASCPLADSGWNRDVARFTAHVCAIFSLLRNCVQPWQLDPVVRITRGVFLGLLNATHP